ncbi:hypothetical protein GCM10028818_12940 [Spirosoma horti]
MRQSTFLRYTVKMIPIFAVGFAIFFLSSTWQTLVDAFNHPPIILKGLGGVRLSLFVVEVSVILTSSIVVSIGVSFALWMLSQEKLKVKQN